MIRYLMITLAEDKEEIEASREKSLGGSGMMPPDAELPSVVPPQPRMKPPSSMDENGGCYVPGKGHFLLVLLDKVICKICIFLPIDFVNNKKVKLNK